MLPFDQKAGHLALVWYIFLCYIVYMGGTLQTLQLLNIKYFKLFVSFWGQILCAASVCII